MRWAHPLLLGWGRIGHWHRSDTIQMPAKWTKIARNDPLPINSRLPTMVTKDGISSLILKFQSIVFFYKATLTTYAISALYQHIIAEARLIRIQYIPKLLRFIIPDINVFTQGSCLYSNKIATDIRWQSKRGRISSIDTVDQFGKKAPGWLYWRIVLRCAFVAKPHSFRDLF